MTGPIAPIIPFPLVDGNGFATPQFLQYWQTALKTAVANALAAQAAAAEAAAAQATANTKQPGDTALTSIADLPGTAGLIEQAAPKGFDIRLIGVAHATDILQRSDGDSRYAGQGVSSWGAPSGTLSRAAYASYAGHTASATYVQAEAQATDDAVKALAQVVVGLITDGIATKALKNP